MPPVLSMDSMESPSVRATHSLPLPPQPLFPVFSLTATIGSTSSAAAATPSSNAKATTSFSAPSPSPWWHPFALTLKAAIPSTVSFPDGHVPMATTKLASAMIATILPSVPTHCDSTPIVATTPTKTVPTCSPCRLSRPKVSKETGLNSIPTSTTLRFSSMLDFSSIPMIPLPSSPSPPSTVATTGNATPSTLANIPEQAATLPSVRVQTTAIRVQSILTISTSVPASLITPPPPCPLSTRSTLTSPPPAVPQACG